MTPRQSMRFLLWYGAKAEAGDTPTEEEFQMFKAARKVSIMMAEKVMRLKPEDYEHTPGQPFEEV